MIIKIKIRTLKKEYLIIAVFAIKTLSIIFASKE
jgi:hypothetical protein